MPRPAMPPTPASSTEIKGQDGAHQLSTLQMAFELPPSAINTNDAARTSVTDLKVSPISPVAEANGGKVTYVQAAETVKSRRRSSTAQKDTFALPPPPTRSRKIIQMKPRASDEPVEASPPAKAAPAAAAKGTTAAASKKKQPSATSAAGRKIARKTAHSLIERRRRSKMNEEFAVLKSLIPACTGEMHKLAILQASIEYVRYLEDCVAKLKSQHENQSSVPTPTKFMLPPTITGSDSYDREYGIDDTNGDVEMTGSEAPSPTFTSTPSRSQQPSISPALLAQDARHRQHSYSSVSTDHRHYSYTASANTSPAFGPQGYGPNEGINSVSNSTLTSPALPPQRDFDQEATAALLMLNTDRRGTNANGAGRGMSVRDLLSA